MKEDFVQNLLKALDDGKVQRKIAEIHIKYENGKVGCHRKEENAEAQNIINGLRQENEELQNKLVGLQTRNRELKSQLCKVQLEKGELVENNQQLQSQIAGHLEEKERLEQTIENIQMDYNSRLGGYQRELKSSSGKLQELEKICFEYKGKYSDIEYYYQCYCSMGGEVHKKLERILSADSPEMFLSWGTQWDNIKALWTEISYWLEENPKEEADRLIEIFDYFFDLYYENNRGNGQKKYVRQDVRVGDEFDAFRHTRSSKSAVAGNITEILLRGYGQMDGEDFELREKSVVKI